MKKFTGTAGNMTEAIRNALKQALEELGKKDVPWKIFETGGNLESDKISVTIQTGGLEGGPGPHK